MELKIGKIEKGEFYLKVAVDKSRKIKKSKAKDSLNILKDNELQKLNIISEELNERLYGILDAFPDFRSLDRFYTELIDIEIGVGLLKKNLGNIKEVLSRVNKIHPDYRVRIKQTRNYMKIKKFKREYLGRVGSVLKKGNKSFMFLEDVRKKARGFPSIKTGIRTICIFGFPNVGKSTLLKKLSGAKVEIKSYPFTTKKLMLGYIGKEIQLIDTPGTLNRFNKMNEIEKYAYLALKYLCEGVIYVFDGGESSGYSVSEQKKLFKRLVKEVEGKEIIVYLSKRDLGFSKGVDFGKRYKVFKDIKELKGYLLK